MPTINSIDSNIPIEISKGGTNASSFSTPNGIVSYDGTRLVSSTTATIDANNYYTNSAHPAFFAYKSTPTNNVTGTGTLYNIVYDSILFQQGSNYNSSTGVFTAPVAGVYVIGASSYSYNVTSSANEIGLGIITTHYSFYAQNQISSAKSSLLIHLCINVQLNAGDTVHCNMYVKGESSDIDNCYGEADGSYFCRFWGYLYS